MPFSTIPIQPVANLITAAYRPIVIEGIVIGTPAPAVTFCDIYFNNVFYRTESKTVPFSTTATESVWKFDIQDAAQEFLKEYLAPLAGSNLESAHPVILKCFCRLRSSNTDADGLIMVDGPEPVRATNTSPAVAGGGLQSNSFYVLNAVLQHADNWNLTDHLSSFRRGSWANGNYPLTHRPATMDISVSDSDYFPVLLGGEVCASSLVVHVKTEGSSSYQVSAVDINQPCASTIINAQVVQGNNSLDATASWEISGDAIGSQYRLDGGPWVLTNDESASLFALAEGAHVFDIRAQCECSEGEVLSVPFTILPASQSCASSVTITEITVSPLGVVTVNFSFTGSATEFRYRINSGAFTTVSASPIVRSDLPEGNYTIEVQPVCAGGAIGAGDTEAFEVPQQSGQVSLYSVRLADFNIVDVCAQPVTGVFSNSANWIQGMTLYYDNTLLSPVENMNRVVYQNQIYNLTIFGQLGSPTGEMCL